FSDISGFRGCSNHHADIHRHISPCAVLTRIAPRRYCESISTLDELFPGSYEAPANCADRVSLELVSLRRKLRNAVPGVAASQRALAPDDALRRAKRFCNHRDSVAGFVLRCHGLA